MKKVIFLTIAFFFMATATAAVYENLIGIAISFYSTALAAGVLSLITQKRL